MALYLDDDGDDKENHFWKFADTFPIASYVTLSTCYP